MKEHKGPLNESSSRLHDALVKQEEYDDAQPTMTDNESNVSHSNSATTTVTANKTKRRGKKAAPIASTTADISSDSLPPLPLRISTTMVGPVAMKVTGKRRFVDDSQLTADDAKKVNAIRAYNRACATRSRHKTKQCIQELRHQVEQLQGEKNVLATEHDRLQHQVDLMAKHNQMLMWTRQTQVQAQTTQTTMTQCGVGNSSNSNSNTGGNNTNISTNANFTTTNAMMVNNTATCFPSPHFYNGSNRIGSSNSTSALRPAMSLGDVLQNSSSSGVGSSVGSVVGPLQFQFQQHLFQQQQRQQQQQISTDKSAQKWNATKL